MTALRPWYRSSTLWIFTGLLLGVALGGFLPRDQHPLAYETFRFLSKAFISLIKGLIVPLLLSTIIVGIAQTGDIKAVGRMGGKALLYFEVVTTLALFIGLAIGNWLKPGANLPMDLSAHTTVAALHPRSGWEIALHLFPSNLIQHAADGDILPVVIFASLFGIALTRVGERGKPVLAFFDGVAQTMFRYTDMVMTLTPLGVFGAMAYNVSAMAAGHPVNGAILKGWPAVFHLLKQYSLLVGSLYFALIALFALVFVPVAWLSGIRILGFIKAIKDPALTAFSTASSEAALPKLLEEVVRFGVPRRVASFVIPTGYSFNLDGSTLYLVLASLTIAQAAGITMSLGHQLLMVFTFMLTSKGVAGVPRATLVIIAGTCGSFGLPGEAGIAMLLAVDEIMDMARTTVNVVGNGLASVVIAKWEGVFGTDTEPLPD
ncbi:proton glutamate symport protein [Geothrix rubra]|uniref:Proton glutamate symport protein n=1 Tax=Geothrix rubra TaxID=2927977 RepID=A0ABQ5Q863_9BACT|nr:cation:dicarboxylase symporter family transporter [Geothrix rubra]GLH70803.1 proton glutamate symport protein [Geothrix rubra]